MDITRNLSGTRALVVGAGLALALAMSAAPTTALAEGRVGTTDVTIRTEIDNIAFKTPTVIPFVAKADGTLQGPFREHNHYRQSFGLWHPRYQHENRRQELLEHRR